jgi:cell division protein FtsL
MTPPPSTAAATGHARSLRRGPGGSRPARRVSGPSRAAGGARAARAAAAARVASRPALRPAPRRPAAAGGAATLPIPLVARLGAVVESRWLDRLLRGRGWIVLVAVGLMGLVFLQVSLLKLNAGIGAAVERAAVLERENADLNAEISKLASNDRIQQLATRAGMVLPPSDDVRYLGKHGKRVGGSSVALVPSQAEASTATLPTVPTTEGELAPADPGTAATTTDPAATATEPQTTSSVPLTPEQRAQQQASGTTGAAPADPAAAGTTATAPAPADGAAGATGDAPTAGAAVGGAAATGG